MKTKMCEDAGIRLIHVWEDDWVERNDETKKFLKDMILGIVQFSKFAKLRDDMLYEVDRSKFNKCAVPDSYEIVNESAPEITIKSRSKKDKYKVADCGKLILKKKVA